MKKTILIISLMLFSIASFSQTCTPSGTLSWKRPTGFNVSEDRVLVFAKKVPFAYCATEVDTLGVWLDSALCVTYIDIGSPSRLPGLYGAADTNLLVLDGAIPSTIQYENDPLAMLIYNDTGWCVTVSGASTDTTYFFAVFNVENGQYSNARYARDNLLYSVKITNLLAIVNRVQWAPIVYYDTAMVIIKQGGSPTGIPTGPAADYLTGVNTDYATSTSYFNGADATDGKIMYVDDGNRFTLSGLSGFSYTVMIYTITDGCWGASYEAVIDNIPDE